MVKGDMMAMLAKDLIDYVVGRENRGRYHVRGLIKGVRSWWHIHDDEELPADYPSVVCKNIKPVKMK